MCDNVQQAKTKSFIWDLLSLSLLFVLMTRNCSLQLPPVHTHQSLLLQPTTLLLEAAAAPVGEPFGKSLLERHGGLVCLKLLFSSLVIT